MPAVRTTATVVVTDAGRLVQLVGWQRRRPTPRAGVHVRTVDARALAVAWDLAGGDRRRLRFEPDGSVLVLNGRRR